MPPMRPYQFKEWEVKVRRFREAERLADDAEVEYAELKRIADAAVAAASEARKRADTLHAQARRLSAIAKGHIVSI